MVQGVRPSARTGARYPDGVTQEHPVLALDVDGVISLFGFEGPIGEAPGRFHLINGMAHCIPDGIGGMLQRPLAFFQVVWAAGRGGPGHERPPRNLGAPGEPPLLPLYRRAPLRTPALKIN